MSRLGRGIPVYCLSILAVGMLSLLSVLPAPFLTRIGAWLGGLYFRIGGKRKKIGLSNLQLAFGKEKTQQELRTILCSSYRQLGSSLLEFASMPRLTREVIDQRVRIEGLERLEEAKRSGRGVLLLTGHFGNWELYAHTLALHGYPLHVIGRRANVGLLNDLIVRFRESHGNRVILRTHAMRKILTVLKQGEILAVLCDQRGSTSRGIFVDFFGHPAPTGPDVARIILKTGAVPLPAFGFRQPDRTHIIIIGDPIPVIRTADPDSDTHGLTCRYMEVLEKFIREHPDQWLWMHRRWMRRGSPVPSR